MGDFEAGRMGPTNRSGRTIRRAQLESTDEVRHPLTRTAERGHCGTTGTATARRGGQDGQDTPKILLSALGSLPQRPNELRERPPGTPPSARAVPLDSQAAGAGSRAPKRSSSLILSILPILSRQCP